jgi:hypothetical protein
MKKTFNEEETVLLCSGPVVSANKMFEFGTFPEGTGSVRIIMWGIDPSTGQQEVDDVEEAGLLNVLAGGPVAGRTNRWLWDGADPARRLALLKGWLVHVKTLLDEEEAKRPTGLEGALLYRIMRTRRSTPVLGLLSRSKLNTAEEFQTAIATTRSARVKGASNG